MCGAETAEDSWSIVRKTIWRNRCRCAGCGVASSWRCGSDHRRCSGRFKRRFHLSESPER